MKNDATIILTRKGICVRHKAPGPASSGNRYSTEQKRCQICEIFLNGMDYGVPAVAIG